MENGVKIKGNLQVRKISTTTLSGFYLQINPCEQMAINKDDYFLIHNYLSNILTKTQIKSSDCGSCFVVQSIKGLKKNIHLMSWNI